MLGCTSRGAPIATLMASFPYVNQRVKNWNKEVQETRNFVETLENIDGISQLGIKPKEHDLVRFETSIFDEIAKWKKANNRDIDVLISTPPCQGMSVANHKKNDELNRNSLVVESISLVNNIRPKFFIFENVKAFLNTACMDTDGELKPIRDAIDQNLAGAYNILYSVVNFKDYGVPSSRNRTIVIGVKKGLYDITPYDVFPDSENQIILRDAIGHLPSLKRMGEIYSKDIYHNFRSFDKRMLDWIKDLKEGQSAFDNDHPQKIPHTIVDGKIVNNQNKNGDKYCRCMFDKVGPCIHTRNDILASQSTIHPKDNRVFSIRELMIMMSVPDSFKWSDIPETTLNKMSDSEKQDFLSKNEMNIRQSLGEAVPTLIFKKIANKIKQVLMRQFLTETEINKLIISNKLTDSDKLLSFLKDNIKKMSFVDLCKISELANSQRAHMSAYYTSQDICYTVVKDMPEADNYDTIRILEPSVGSGNFIPLIMSKYKTVQAVELDLIDIDAKVLDALKIILSSINIPKNIKINYICDDFITHVFDNKYDLIIGNPPFKKIENNPQLLSKYKQSVFNNETNNLFSFFIEKSLKISKYVALITPKSLLSTPEFNKTRVLLETKNIEKIIDYGEFAFDVKIETIALLIRNIDTSKGKVKIESYITKTIIFYEKEYIFSNKFPYWLIYRDKFFDGVANKMTLNVFDAFRDRQITKKITKNKGKYRVLKSRNLSEDGTIVNLSGYDCYIDDLTGLQVAKYLNNTRAVIVPNLSYYPRAGLLPKNSIADGSLAILLLKNLSKNITSKQLKYFASEEFTKYYKISRNYGTRSLNIDKNSVFFWGLLK